MYMNLFKRLPIRTKLLIVLLLVSVLPLLVATYGFYRLARIKLTEQTIHILDVQAKNTLSVINHYISFKFKHIHRFVDISRVIHILKKQEMQDCVLSQTIASFNARLRIDPDFLAILLLDGEGNVVLSTNEVTNENYAPRPFFYEAMKGKSYVSVPCRDRGIACIYFSEPVIDEGKKLGVVVLQCKAEELWYLIEHEGGRVGVGNMVILSNADGVRIAHSRRGNLVFKSWAPLKPEIKEQILKEKRYGSDINEISFTELPEVMDAVITVSTSKYIQHRLVVGEGTYHSVLLVMDNGWRIICTIPESTFLEPVKNNLFYMLIIVGIVACVVTVLSVIIGRFGTKRINIFASISKEIAKGDFTRGVPFSNGDEIGQLGNAFNIMITSIKRKIEQLRYLNDVTIEIHHHTDLDRLLQNLANIAKRLVNAEMSALLLLGEGDEEIKHFKVSLPNSSGFAYIGDRAAGIGFGGMTLSEGVGVGAKTMVRSCGLLGTVLEKGQSVRLDKMPHGQHLAMLPAHHPSIHTFLGVPIKINQKVVGGLFLGNKVNDERFTLEDEEMLFTLAYQASVAIENAKLYGEAHQLAITDGLTGLLNHKEFHRRLDEYIEGSKRYQYPVSLLMIDIDHFKHFNDTYGHQVGDQVLKTVGDLIKTHVRVVDVCARYGGEEFAVILPETDTPRAIVLSERIRSAIYAYPFKYGGVISQLSVSIGIASCPHDASCGEELIKKADSALYTAKNTGRNKVCCYNQPQSV